MSDDARVSTLCAALTGLLAGPLVRVGIAATSRRPTPSAWWWPAVLAAGSACAGGWAGYWTTSAWPAVAWWVLLVTGVGLAMVDLREHRLPTPLIAAAALGVAVALTVATARDGDWSRWWQAAAAAAAAFVVFYVLAMISGMGYGDVKLAAVIAGCAGYSSPAAAAATLLAGLLIAGLAGLVLLAAGRGRGHQLALGPWLLLGAATGLAVLGHAG